MSTLSGKSIEQTGPAALPSGRSNEEPNVEDVRGAQDGDAPPSAYAPKRFRVVSSATTEPAPVVDLGAAPPRFLMRDNKSRAEQQRVEPRLVVDAVDGSIRLHSMAGDATARRRQPVDLDEVNFPLEPNRQHTAAQEQHTAAPETEQTEDRSDQSPVLLTDIEPPATAPSAATSQETDDPERLEASLRWLRSQDVGSPRDQLPRKPHLIAEPRSLGILHARRHDGAIAEAGIREPKSLEPESLLAPALRRAYRDSNRGPRWLLVACVAAPLAPLAVLAVTMLTPATEPQRDMTLASAASQPAVRISAAEVQLPVLTFDDQTDDLAMPSMVPAPAVARTPDPVRAPLPAEKFEPPTRAPITVIPPAPPATETNAVVQPPPAAALPPAAAPQPTPPQLAPPPAPALRQMDLAEVRILVRQGEQFMAVGDVVSARMVFLRAAETGDAGAAMALGATYDPLILARLRAVGMIADVSKARQWYQQAKELGSQEAPRRLELLANR